MNVILQNPYMQSQRKEVGLTRMFIWTARDVVGAVLIGAVILIYVVALAMDRYDSWKKKRRGSK
ncbi:hypothetical protein D3C71_743360 [compost metagenome]